MSIGGGIECTINRVGDSYFDKCKDFAIKIAEMAGYNSNLIIGKSIRQISKVPMPSYSALASARGFIMPSLDHAVKCFFKECITLPNYALAPQ